MRVFLDLNVILDVALDRRPFVEDSEAALEWCAKNASATVLAWHTITNAYYLLRKEKGDAETRLFLKALLAWTEVAPVGNDIAESAIDLPGGDLEDKLQIKCAEAANVDVIVTRDPKGFKDSPLKALNASEFVDEVGTEVGDPIQES